MKTEEHKYNVGDKLIVVSYGRGVGPKEKGSVVTVAKLGVYRKGKMPGYVLKEHIGNSNPSIGDYDVYKGVIAESMFKLYKKARKGPKKKLNICKK